MPDTAHARLRRFALSVAGPADALINIALNAAIPWYFLRTVSELPLWGWFSVAVFLGPMFFLLFWLATYFGIRNGVLQRKSGAAGNALAHDVPWRGWAMCRGLLYGSGACLAFLIAIRGIDRLWPGLAMPAVALNVLQATLAGLLGYAVQVHGVLMSARLKP